MSTLNRRDFLKVLGVSSTASLAACDVLVDPKVPLENVLPYVVVPDQIVPGLSTWFATQCNECGGGCGTLARNREGRIVKLEGNPDHPTNQGNLCARGQAGLLATYSPDRFAGPMQAGAATDWDTALKAAADAITAARGAGKEVAWVGSYRTGSLAALVGQFVGALGGRALHWEPLGLDDVKAAAGKAFGKAIVPSYVLDDAHTIVSFGAEFLATWGNQVASSLGYANSRDPNKGGFVSRLVCVEPRVGNTSAMADLHLAASPGSEAGVALALAKLLADKNGYSGPAQGLLAGIDPAAAASAAGVSMERLEEVVGWLAAGPSVVLPGGTSTSAAPTDLAVATFLLNEVAGNIGKSVVFGLAQNGVAHSSYAEVSALLADCAAGKVGVLFVDGLDLAHALPGVGRDAIDKVDLSVFFANEPSDSLGGKSLVLPPGSTLETWGDAEGIRGRHTLQQPAMRALKDSRSVGDVLLSLAKALSLTVAAPEVETAEEPPAQPGVKDGRGGAVVLGGADKLKGPKGVVGSPIPPGAPAAEEPAVVLEPIPAPGFEAASFKDYVAAFWKATVWVKAGRPGTFEAFWRECQVRGGYFFPIERENVRFQLAALPGAAAAAPEGSGKVLTLFPHPFLHDGRHANRPWAQEVPEPLSTYTWGTWVEINPEVAAELGLTKEDGVVVKTAAGEIEVGWFGSPGIRKDTVAVVIGNGHDNAGRYARFGKNAFTLVAAAADADGARTLVNTRAEVKRSGKPNPLFAVAGSLTQEGRGVNYAVDASALEGAHGAGSLVHGHHIPTDERLERAGLHDMYPEPEHPTYRFAMAVDLNRCTGCGSCETACYAENNLPVVGPDQVRKSRNMGWIRLSRYWEGEGEHPDVRFQPVMCQQCSHAPCEGVCPVLATYHNLDGLNAMIYNRCVGTRYCANNCPYTARRFNYHTFTWPEPFHLMLNPDVSTRTMGVMEKCTFCIQRIRETKDTWRDKNKQGLAPDEALQNLPSCAQACPADAMVFGNLKDPDSKVAKMFEDPRAYAMLNLLNTKPGVRYLARITHTAAAEGGHGGEHH